MKWRLLVGLLVAAAAVGLVLKLPRGGDPQEQRAAFAEDLLLALERGDYDRFLRHADKGLRHLRPDDFAALAAQNAARLKGGHLLAYLDESERSNVRVSRWRVTFKDGSPEAVMTLGIRDGEVVMFSLR
jgi:hypothetical protein